VCGPRVSESVRGYKHGDRRRRYDNANKSWRQKSRRKSGKAKSARDGESGDTLAPETGSAAPKKSDGEVREGPFSIYSDNFPKKTRDVTKRTGNVTKRSDNFAKKSSNVSKRSDNFTKKTSDVTKRTGNAGKGKWKSFSDVSPKRRATASAVDVLCCPGTAIWTHLRSTISSISEDYPTLYHNYHESSVQKHL